MSLFDSEPDPPQAPRLTVTRAIALIEADTPPSKEEMLDLLRKVKVKGRELEARVSDLGWAQSELHDRLRAESDERVGRMGGGG
jgi:hypothetical protein